ncbi:MAG: hypothetical protein GXO21_07245 [Aquificae bacterium]|nr:hypothetical protein [Aquificota bacterium]
MKFYKARHIWVNGQNATWTKSDEFDNEIFETLKSKYEELKGSQQKFITVDGKTLFLFYRVGKDFSNRPITEITAFLSYSNFSENEKVHKALTSQIEDVFEDKLEYSISIDNDFVKVKKKDRKIIIGVIMSFLVALAVVGYLNFWNDSGETYKRSIEERNVTRTITKVRIDELKKDVHLTKEVNSSNRKIGENPIEVKEAKKKSNPIPEKVVEIDFKEFVTEWNKKVERVSKKYTLNLDQYKIDKKKDVVEQVNNFINYKKGEKKLEKNISKKIREDKELYRTLNKWIEKRKNKFKSNKITELTKSSELRKAIEENLNFNEPFSNKMIEEILTWNEFTLYFEKNKTENDKKNGFKSCRDVEERIEDNYELDLNICIDNPKNKENL